MDQPHIVETMADPGSGTDQQRAMDRPRSARRRSQRPSVHDDRADSRVSPSSTTSTIDDDEDEDDEELPPVLGDPFPPPRTLHLLQTAFTAPGPDHWMSNSAAADQRSPSSGRSPLSTMTTASDGGPCLVNLTEARQRVLDRYDRTQQRSPSSRTQNFDSDSRRSMTATEEGDVGIRRRRQRLEPLATDNVRASTTIGVEHHHNHTV